MDTRSKDLESYFNFIKACAITGIFAYHEYDFVYEWGSVARRIDEGLLHNLFYRAESLKDYLAGFFQMFFALGSTGVELFVLASGFGLYLSRLKKKSSWKSFYIRRALRILPLYWTVLFFLYFVSDIVYPKSLASLVYHFFLIQNFTPYYLNFGAFWFVSYIAFLYLLFPLLAKVFAHARAKWALFLISFFLTPLIKWIMNMNGLEFMGGELPTRFLPLFLLGMIIAEDYFKGRSRPAFLSPLSSACALVLTGVLIALLNYYPESYFTLRLCLGALLFWGLYLFYMAVRPFSLARRITDMIAYGSYAFFLLHVSLIFLLTRIPSVLRFCEIVSGNSNFYLNMEYYVLLVIFCFYLQKIFDVFTKRLFSDSPGLAPKPGLT